MEIKVSNTADSFQSSKLTSVQCWWDCGIYHHRLIGIWKIEHIEFWPRVMTHSIAEKFQISDSPRVLPGAPWLKLTRTITAAAIASIILKWNVTSRTKCTYRQVGDNLVFFNLLQNWWEKVLFTLEDFQCPSFWLLHWEVNENPETLFAFILHKHAALYYTCVAGMFSLKLVSRHGVQFQIHSIVTRTPEAKWVWLMFMQQWGTHCKWSLSVQNNLASQLQPEGEDFPWGHFKCMGKLLHLRRGTQFTLGHSKLLLHQPMMLQIKKMVPIEI